MMTKFDVGEEVYLKATVIKIGISQQDEIQYTLTVQDVARRLSVMEENIVKKGDNNE